MERMRKSKAILYSRVSTTHDEQAESIENQILLARNYLDKHPDIELAEPLEKYSERISGKTDVRPRFQELCERLSRGDVQYLMVKDLKRLSRSVETTYAFFNVMKQYDFRIIQLSSGSIIDSKAFEEAESSLLLGIEALFAQNTVLTQSRYGKIVQKVRCENRIISRKDATLFGYKWDSSLKDVVIEEEKAEVVRELYNRYVFRNQTIYDLRDYVLSLGYHYSIVSISKWLQEGKYVGDWTINRKGSVLGIGRGAKSHRFDRDKSEWVHIERPDLAIVDKDIFDLAQEIRLSRVKEYTVGRGREKIIGNFNGKHLFARKIYCAECGSGYRFKWADRNRTVAVYRDTYRDYTGRDCPNTRFRKVYEEDIKEIVVKAILALNIKGRVSMSGMIKAIATAIRSTDSEEREIENEKKKMKKLEKEAAKISDAFIEATSAMRSRLNLQLEEIEKRIDDCKSTIYRLEHRNADEEAIKARLLVIEKQLSGWIDVSKESLTRIMVERLISRITVHMNGVIDVSIVFGNLKSYQITKVSNSQTEESNEAVYDLPSKQVINDNLRRIYEVGTDKKEKVSLNVASFQEKGQGSKMTVMVTLDT